MANNRLILRNLNSPWVVPTTDITKNSVLSWADLDNNFIYLKGELINSSELDGEELILNKINGNNINVDLSDLVTPLNNKINYISGQTVTSISFDQNNYDLSIISNNGVLDTINLSILSQDIFVTGGTYDNSTGVVTFNKNNGDSFDIPGFITGFTDFYTTGVTLNGTLLEFDRTDSINAYSVDISSINSDNFVTGGTYNSSTESIDFSGTSSETTFSVNVSDLLDDTNTFTTGAALNGTVLEFDRTDQLNAYDVDLSDLDWTGGTNYILVKAEGTDIQNATELQDAYNLAVSMSPTSNNRVTILVTPGYYNFGGSIFEMNSEYIDLVSLDGNRSVIFNATLNDSTFSGRTEGSLNVTANNVFVKGVDVLDKNFTIGNDLNQITIENCKGGDFSFGGVEFGDPELIVSGTFIDCEGGDLAFAGNGDATGLFKDCIGGDESFGFTEVTGTFINCEGGDLAFGAFGLIDGATFENCKAGLVSYGSGPGGVIIDSNLKNSDGDDFCFGSNALGVVIK